MTDHSLRFIRDGVTMGELAAMADAGFGDMVKVVVDLQRGVRV
jgi:hypothetical protein